MAADAAVPLLLVAAVRSNDCPGPGVSSLAVTELTTRSMVVICAVATVTTKLSVARSPSASLTVYVKAYVPAAVGVPASTRVAALKLRPATPGERL